ncbi:unnamed protein product [Cuscuta epithymum]|uniref:Secreted protein n=1 Tax=Cuscuta epithymum TaxID=186058 RepID=A0AAV0C3K6_9ASTE|nr:unnamed protein product [Cuscuta epithymum]
MLLLLFLLAPTKRVGHFSPQRLPSLHPFSLATLKSILLKSESNTRGMLATGILYKIDEDGTVDFRNSNRKLRFSMCILGMLFTSSGGSRSNVHS